MQAIVSVEGYACEMRRDEIRRNHHAVLQRDTGRSFSVAACLLGCTRDRDSGAIQRGVLPQQQLQGPQQDVEVFPGEHEHRGVGEGGHGGGPGLPPQQGQLPKVHGGPQPHHLLHTRRDKSVVALWVFVMR